MTGAVRPDASGPAPGPDTGEGLAALLESISDAFFAVDADWRFTYVNGGAERFWRRSRADLLGRGFWEAFPQAGDSENGRALERAMRERATVVWESRSPMHGTWLQARAYPAANGGLSVFFQDVEERKRVEAERVRLMAELQAANGQLRDQQRELELSNQQLQEQAVALEARAEELQATAAHLEEQIEAADRSAAALGASDARYRALLSSIDAGFCVIAVLVDDAQRPVDYQFLETNPAFVRQGGFGDPVGRRMSEIAPSGHEFWYATYGRVAATGEPARLTHDAPALGRVYDVFAYRVDDPAQRHVAVLFTDVTAAHGAARERERLLAESERARAEAEAARSAAEAAARAKAEFLATMSHEIRTPINAIVGYTQLLELGIPDPATPAQQQQLTRVTASAQHLLGLVNDVLDVAKIDAGELRVAREHAATGPAVAAALALVRPLSGERGVRLVGGRAGDPGHPDDPAGVPYVGDEARVRQILVNLLSNAVKFTPAGGTVAVAVGTAGEAPLAVRVEGAGPWAYVRVADTGVGIPPAQQAAVFEPFVQVEAGHTRAVGGTGLGLTISRRLARLMGGDLTLESAPGVGSTFTLWLPATGIAAAGGPEAAESPAARGERAGLPGAGWRVHGLAEIGRALREATDVILEAYAATLRADPAVPLARAMRQAQLEDHAITLLADLAQSLVILADAGEDAAALMGDGTAIQRAVAEAHGARRCAQGWDEPAVRRDHAVLHDVVERAVRARVASRAGDVSEELRVLTQLQARIEALSVAAYRHACAAAEAGDAAEAPAD